MVAIDELIPIRSRDLVDENAHSNILRLHYALNSIARLWGQPMFVNRGFSTLEEQIRIYQMKGLPPKLQSCHLIGAAADIRDEHQLLQQWLTEHSFHLQRLNLYCEAFHATPTWVHFQIYPPHSGTLFFEP